ncbi:hypothetical protein ACED29_02720 [Shewanella sp. 5S214]|uniref:hypothetical protein n=1 Tax=Shewanella sp. 5S214 TaxID=3229999 RepID=UPI00352CC013
MKKIIIVALFTALNGCSADETTKFSDNGETITSPASATLTADDKNKPKETIVKSPDSINLKNKNGSFEQSKYTIQFNKQKFTTKSRVLKANQSVYNLDINSFGMIKGSLVVVSTIEPKELQPDFDIKKLADDTYQLTAKSAELDLYYWYTKLSGDPRYSAVELEIDYSPKNELKTY